MAWVWMLEKDFIAAHMIITAVTHHSYPASLQCTLPAVATAMLDEISKELWQVLVSMNISIQQLDQRFVNMDSENV